MPTVPPSRRKLINALFHLASPSSDLIKFWLIIYFGYEQKDLLRSQNIVITQRCYGCAGGAGSSCQGTVA
ncbi:DUF3641 domain-containing protein [Muricauda sp. CAU 1633]|nr:DUF3641 domain-containing protein [Muricauda sp. CAU 1633]